MLDKIQAGTHAGIGEQQERRPIIQAVSGRGRSQTPNWKALIKSLFLFEHFNSIGTFPIPCCWTQMTLNSCCSFCLFFPEAVITGVCHHVGHLLQHFKKTKLRFVILETRHYFATCRNMHHAPVFLPFEVWDGTFSSVKKFRTSLGKQRLSLFVCVYVIFIARHFGHSSSIRKALNAEMMRPITEKEVLGFESRS